MRPITNVPNDLLVTLTILYTLTFLIAFPGNALGLFIVYRRRSFRNTMNLLIMNMCFADLMLIVMATPLNLIHLYRRSFVAGVAGEVFCKISNYSLVVTIAASILTILIISCERFFAICYPLKGKLLSRPRVVSMWIWVLAFVMMIPYAILYRNVYIESKGIWACTMWLGNQTPQNFMKIHYLILFIVLYAVPVVIIAGLNSMIVYRLARSRMPGESHGASREIAVQVRHKAVKMLIALLAVFAICWLPTHVMHYLITMRYDIVLRLPRGVPYFSFWLGNLNSALNPIIYVLLSDNFRRDFTALVFRNPNRRSKTFSVKATTSVMISRDRSGSVMGRFSHRFSETLSLKSFPRTSSFRHVNPLECMSLSNTEDKGEEVFSA